MEEEDPYREAAAIGLQAIQAVRRILKAVERQNTLDLRVASGISKATVCLFVSKLGGRESQDMG